MLAPASQNAPVSLQAVIQLLGGAAASGHGIVHAIVSLPRATSADPLQTLQLSALLDSLVQMLRDHSGDVSAARGDGCAEPSADPSQSADLLPLLLRATHTTVQLLLPRARAGRVLQAHVFPPTYSRPLILAH